MNRFRQKSPPEKPSQPDRPRSLREFKDEPANPRSSRRRRRRFRRLFRLLLITVILVLGIAGAFFAPKFFAHDQIVPERIERPTVSSASDEVEVADLIEGYLNALGGRTAVEEVRSLRYEGQVNFGSEQNDFQILVSLPDMGMLNTNPGEPDGLKYMRNGDIVWRLIEWADGARKVELVDAETAASLKWSLEVHNTFRRLALEGRHAELSVGETEFMGKPCYELTKTMPDGSEFRAILEKETLYLVKFEETLRYEERKDKFTIVYDDHRMVSGVVEPFKTTLYKNGELNNEVELDSLRVNPGVVSSIFKVPDELLQ